MLYHVSTLSILELSISNSNNEANNDGAMGIISGLLYEKHWWTHYMSLLSSTFYLFAFYLLWYQSRLIPKVLSLFGLFAVSMMFVEMLASIYGQSIDMMLMLPLGIAQLSLIIWLLIKGISTQKNAV